FILLRETLEADGPFLFYAHPLGLRTDRPAVVLFVIPTANLLGVVSGAAAAAASTPVIPATATGRGTGSFVLIDPYGTVVLAHPPLDRSVLATAVRYAQDPAPAAAATQIDRHVIARATSAESGWTAMLVTPIEATTMAVRDELRGLLIVVLLLVVVEIVLLEIFLRWNYRPVSVLLQDIEHPDRPSTMTAGALPAELSAVHTALHNAHRAQAVDRATRELVVELERAVPDAVAISALLGRIGIDASTPGFRALSARVTESSATIADCSAVVQGALEPFGIAVHQIEANPRGVVWLIAGPDESLAEPIERVYPQLVSVVGETVHIGIGPFVKRADGVGRSVRDARDAAQVALLTGCPSIASAGMATTEGAQVAGQPRRNDTNALSLAIESGTTDDAVAAVTQSVATLRARSAPSSDLLRDALALSAMVARRIGSKPVNGESDAFGQFLDRLHHADASILDGTMSLDAWGRSLAALIADADQSRRERTARSSASAGRATEVLAYVEKHLFDPNLSLAAVAGSVGVSLSTAASLFKQQTGTTLTGYVGDRRVTEAKRLLRDGVPVNDVVDRIGYRDSTSFIRKFKRMTGTTPGEWLHARMVSADRSPSSRQP
ncbi:MAG: AraC family transcriptional regulator, partial [Spirochaetaceae bacterium]